MNNNILFDTELSDNEQRSVYVIEFNNPDRHRMKMAIYASSLDEASHIFFKQAGERSVMLKIQKMTESEYKEKY